MSSFSRNRRKRLRNFNSRLKWNGGPDREFASWRVIDIHQIPSELEEGSEFDFWITNDKDIYLLSLKRSPNERFTIVKSFGITSSMTLIGELQFDGIDDDLIKKVLSVFVTRGIPKYSQERLLLTWNKST